MNSSKPDPQKQENSDSLKKYYQSQAALRVKRVNQQRKELNEVTEKPKISTASKSMASNFKVKEEISSTQAPKGIKTAEEFRYSPRKTTLSNHQNSPVKIEKHSEITLNLAKAQQWLTKSKKSSIQVQSYSALPLKTQHGHSYEHILELIEFNSKNIQENQNYPRWVPSEGKTIAERSKFWHEKKMEKIQREKTDKLKSEMEKCSFSPAINLGSPGRFEENGSFSRNKSYSVENFDKEAGFSDGFQQSVFKVEKKKENKGKTKNERTYEPICPENKRMTYSLGFDIESFRNRAKPMVDYTLLSTAAMGE